MSTNEHLFTIIEPAPGGDSTLDVARQTIARGGSASVALVITPRVEQDIQDFAASEDIGSGQAETLALDQFLERYRQAIGGDPTIAVHYGTLGSDVLKHMPPNTTAIAVPANLAKDRIVERLAAYTGRPVIVAPARRAVAA